MTNQFNLNKINQYIKDRDEYLSNHLGNSKQHDFNLNAIFSLFDKNYDGKISRNEFRQVSKIEYSNYVEQLKNYNSKNGNEAKNNSIWTYEQIENYLDDAFFTTNEAEIICYKGQSKDIDLSGIKGLKEEHNLKDISQMSKEEMIAELQSYGINTENMKEIKIKRTLETAREERIKQDIGSNEVDGHIGTYSQGKSLYCTVLAQIDTLSDEEVAKMYQKEPKLDSNGKKYWEVKFPCDDNNDKIVIITEDELKDQTIVVDDNGKYREIADFPDGDKDVMLLTMAFVKRFGTHITDNAAWAFQTKNKFVSSSESVYVDNQHLEDFTIDDFKNMPSHSQIGLLNREELARKGIDTSGENLDLSWLPLQEQISLIEPYATFELSNGIKGCISKGGILLSNGTKIVGFHALSVRRFDEESNELVVSQNEFGNLSELRIPIELARFLETASLPDANGAKRTPIPDVTE